jgi:hypothetical protein
MSLARLFSHTLKTLQKALPKESFGPETQLLRAWLSVAERLSTSELYATHYGSRQATSSVVLKLRLTVMGQTLQ